MSDVSSKAKTRANCKHEEVREQGFYYYKKELVKTILYEVCVDCGYRKKKA